MPLLTDPGARRCGPAAFSCLIIGRLRPLAGMRGSQLAGTDTHLRAECLDVHMVNAPPCAAIGAGIGLIQVRLSSPRRSRDTEPAGAA